MPRVMVNLRLSDEEKALLKRRADKEGMTDADYLRMCMLMDALMSGDFGAAQIFGAKVRAKLLEKVGLGGDRLKNALSKA